MSFQQNEDFFLSVDFYGIHNTNICACRILAANAEKLYNKNNKVNICKLLSQKFTFVGQKSVALLITIQTSYTPTSFDETPRK